MKQLVAPQRQTPSSAGLVTHPTAVWTDLNRHDIPLIATRGNETRPLRTTTRALRQGPLIPWLHLAFCLGTLIVLLGLLLAQKAQLVSAQYTLVDLKGARTRQLKLQDDLKLEIQALTALDRVDGLSRTHLRMVAPAERLVLDLSLLPRTASAHILAARVRPSRF